MQHTQPELDHRPFEDGDAAIICRFVQSAEELYYLFPEAAFPLSPDVLIKAAHQRACPTVALLDGKVAGFASFQEVRERRFCTIDNLVVDPQLRRMGIATFLVETMATFAAARYCVRFVRAACFSHNTPAYQLYHKRGFRPADMVLRRAPGDEMWLLVQLHRKTGC